MLSPSALFALIVCVGLFTALCTFWDVRWMKMPNKITVPAFFAGLVFHFARGWLEHESIGGGLYELFWWSICGFAVGFGVLFISFATGRGGGGDVKFMGALGAWLGPWWTVVVLIGTAVYVVITGTISLVLVASKKGISSAANSSGSPFRSRKKINQTNTRQRLVAYAIPVTCAVWTLFGLLLVNEFTPVKFSFLKPRSNEKPAAAADSALQLPHAIPS